MKTDVLIVGAGLAGSTLGFLLRQAGKDVLAIEIQDITNLHKLCAGAVYVGAIKTFDEIYGPGAFKGLSPYVVPSAVFRCLDVEGPGAMAIQTMPREQLDGYCLSRYLDEGGRIVDRAKPISIDAARHVATFKNLRDGTTFEVTYQTLVGADGAASAVRRFLTGRSQRACAALQGTVPHLIDGSIFGFHFARQGYCWYIPHKEDATVGVMLHGEAGKGCREFLSEFCASIGIEMPALRGAPIPEGDDVLLQAGEDAWLIGDAAGLIGPFYGGGIAHGLNSGRALANALTGGEPYEQAMAETIHHIEHESASLRDSYLMTSLGLILKAKRQEEKTQQ